ncbi:hypothetical protein F1B92_01765 [Campylobacter sp. FMV-PI01]|uniref:Uncharacterized protein n=1 Tax=Campylobacter portucalensis TaxID=2608384 RepID=A0A6L5WJL6_9BACT|nr:hypothetical protein [Campylobacter portucalensis]MSN95931.1 hypothetical protein [Campylobacter portucalensis]
MFKFLISTFFVLFALKMSIFASSNIDFLKETFRAGFMMETNLPTPLIGEADRIEADILLELSQTGYKIYKDFKNYENKPLINSDEILLIMPRIDLLEKHLNSLAKTTKTLYLFIMEDDKLDGEYGDRSYETFQKKGLEKSLPKNVKLFKLKNESVTSFGTKNNYEISNIKNSLVYINQIQPMYRKNSKIYQNINSKKGKI